MGYEECMDYLKDEADKAEEEALFKDWKTGDYNCSFQDFCRWCRAREDDVLLT